MGVWNCPEAQSLLRDELVKFCELTSSLIRADRSPLPQGVGSIATILWQEKMACDGYDHPPHMASNSGCMVHFAEDYSDDDSDDESDENQHGCHPAYWVNALSWEVAAATHSGCTYDKSQLSQPKTATGPPILHKCSKGLQQQTNKPPCNSDDLAECWSHTPIPTQNTEQAWVHHHTECWAQEPLANMLDPDKKFHYVSHMQKSVDAESMLEPASPSHVWLTLVQDSTSCLMCSILISIYLWTTMDA